MLTRCLLLLSLFCTTAHAAVDAKTLAQALDARMETATAAGFSGSVLVADGDTVLFERGYGLADPTRKIAIDADTRFNLASTGKLFTTVAVLQLVQQGKIDLDANVGRYLSDWPVATVRDRVTVRQLLLHTSGLGAFWGPEFEAMRSRLKTLSDYRPLLAKEPDFAPGTQWQYSNSGFLLLGLIVEAASGEDYYDYVASHIFSAAGMRDTGYFAIDGKADNVAVPHKGGNGDDRYSVIAPLPEPRGGAAGGGYSTPRDLLRFHRALSGGKLLDAARLELFFGAVALPAAEGGRKPLHGLGVLRFDSAGDVVYGHPGGAPGIGVDVRAARRSGWALVVMSNAEEPRAMQIGHELADIVAKAGGADLRFPPPPRPKSPKPPVPPQAPQPPQPPSPAH